MTAERDHKSQSQAPDSSEHCLEISAIRASVVKIPIAKCALRDSQGPDGPFSGLYSSGDTSKMYTEMMFSSFKSSQRSEKISFMVGCEFSTSNSMKTIPSLSDLLFLTASMSDSGMDACHAIGLLEDACPQAPWEASKRSTDLKGKRISVVPQFKP